MPPVDDLVLHVLLRKLQQLQHIMAGRGLAAAASGLAKAAGPTHTPVRALHTVAAAATNVGAGHCYAGAPHGQQPSLGAPKQRAAWPPAGSGGGRAGRGVATTAVPRGRSRVAGTPFGRGGRQPFSIAAAAAAQPAAGAGAAAEVVEPGRLVEFKRGNEYRLGLVVKASGKAQWVVEDTAGVRYSVGSKEVACVLPGANCSPADLAAVAQEAAGLADASLLELAWELSEPTALYTVPEMAVFIFGEASPATCAAAHRLLREDRAHFKQAGRAPPMFSPRAAEQVQQLQRQAAVEAQEAATWAAFAADIAAAQKLPRGAKPGEAAWAAGPHGQRLALLAGYATGEAGDGDKVKAIKALNELHMAPTPQAAAEVLQGIGYWPPHQQLSLLTSGITETFRPELEELAQQLLDSPPPDPDAARRRNLTHLPVYTIDDDSTTEIDDGLSIERLPSGETRVWVHVADPSRWVQPGGTLDAEAQRRSTSIYLPTGVIPMFPKRLAEGPFSLREGVPCCAMSVGLVLGPEGEVLLDQIEVTPSTIVPTQRLSYNTADEIFDHCTEAEEPDLFALLKAAEVRWEHRMDRGAIEIIMPECEVEVDDPQADNPVVTITKDEPALSLARQVVAEMMILAGEAMGMLGGKLGTPLPYRGQPEPVLPDEKQLEAVPEGPCQAILLRNCMVRSQTVTNAPLRHSGLGLEAYVQFTSPIRRYGDLVAHMQMKAQLRGEAPPYSAEELGALMDGVAGNAQKMGKLEREVESYWTAHYFLQQQRANPRAAYEAMFLCWFKQDVGLARVLLTHLGLETVVRVSRSGAAPGSSFYVRCAHADPRLGVFRLDEVNYLVDPNDVVGYSSSSEDEGEEEGAGDGAGPGQQQQQQREGVLAEGEL